MIIPKSPQDASGIKSDIRQDNIANNSRSIIKSYDEYKSLLNPHCLNITIINNDQIIRKLGILHPAFK